MPQSLSLQALKKKRIVITRPVNQTENIKQKLEQAGAHPIFFPLIEITPPDDLDKLKKQFSDLNNYDVVIFISTNAVEQALSWVKPSLLKSTAIATTGKKTKKLLQEYNVNVDFCPQQTFNSEALLAVDNFIETCANKQVAIIRGEGGRDYLKKELLKRGATVEYIDAYQRICPQNSLDVLTTQQKDQPIDALLFTSGTSIKYFFNLAINEPWVNSATLILGSLRMQKKIPSTFKGKLVIAQDPSDETLLKELATIF